MAGRLAGLALILALASCASGTYYDADDRYVIGMRWFDRERYDEAIHYCFSSAPGSRRHRRRRSSGG